jgi:hypothetical protein
VPEDNKPIGIYLNAAVKPLEERAVPDYVLQLAEQKGVEIVGYQDACQIYAKSKAEGGLNAQPPTIEGFIVRSKKR